MPEEQILLMTPAGWAFLAISWATITGLVVFCISRMFRSNRRVKPDKTPLE